VTVPPKKTNKKKPVIATQPDYLLELADIALQDHSPPAANRAAARELREQNKALRKSNRELLDFAHDRIKKLKK
jgi:hypothetical protein